MGMFRKKLATSLQDRGPNTVEQTKDYGLSDLNWKDDGDALMDPSINDYNKGYQMEPYEMRYYANKLQKVESGDSLGSIAVLNDTTLEKLYELNGFSKDKVTASSHLKIGSYVIVERCACEEEENVKEAAKEVIDITYTPENLAKEILTLWSQVDGPLQNFYDGFTMNKMNNKMKQDIADLLNEWGYEVTPTYTQDTPIYANAFKSLKKVASKKNPEEIVGYFKQIFPDSYALELLSKEIDDLSKEASVKITLAEAGGLADYYKQIFPEDYAMDLVTTTFDKPEINFDEFQDIQISDEALTQMEKMDSGNQNPTGGPNDGGVGGYDFTTQMRSDGGFPAGNYEVRAQVKKK